MKALSISRAEQALAGLDGDWSLAADGRELRREFRFPDFHHTMAFVNAVAWIAHRADHHPELEVGYGRCSVRWSTHAAGGLTGKDFDAAARVDALVAGG
jgi:4a-hydroxytetrahydrobiopterin dehydratase